MVHMTATDRQTTVFLHADDKVSDRLPPWRTLQSHAVRRVDATAGWLLKHGFEAAAVGLWRICRMW